MSKLIIDSGSSKVEWSWISESIQTSAFSIGIHPFFLNSWQIATILREQIASYSDEIKDVSEIFFYGTGINSEIQSEIIQESLHMVFPAARYFIADDILAAARALCQNSRGIACILGTGSNACYYDGSQLVYKRSGYGYILGDEGSGAYLGKMIVKQFLNKQLTPLLLKKMEQRFHITPALILEGVYRNPFANQYLASFSYFLSENRGDLMIEELINSGIDEFFKTRLVFFPERTSLPVHFTGSIAFVFQDVLLDLAVKHNVHIGNICKSPMSGLLEFHKSDKL